MPLRRSLILLWIGSSSDHRRRRRERGIWQSLIVDWRDHKVNRRRRWDSAMVMVTDSSVVVEESLRTHIRLYNGDVGGVGVGLRKSY